MKNQDFTRRHGDAERNSKEFSVPPRLRVNPEFQI
jgi:hypothetical protein